MPLNKETLNVNTSKASIEHLSHYATEISPFFESDRYAKRTS